MASISNIPTNSRSMNGIIILSDGVCNIEDGNITTKGDIITSNITTNDINLNLGVVGHYQFSQILRIKLVIQMY